LNSFLHETIVEFCHTDAAGIAHFSALMQYAEQAEHAFLRSLGLSVFPRSSGARTWPRVKVTAEFFGPAYFEDVLKVELTLKRIGETSVTYMSSIYGPSGKVAMCETVCVCCTHSVKTPGSLQKASIPPDIREKLCEFLS
jgi:4-hydroxybenzoyl-CoA thioesterase/acyl-CoA thioester hydrolase